ncbi:MAG: hypothetical protein WBY53_18355 [Acidobacteriaceae bacterium]
MMATGSPEVTGMNSGEWLRGFRAAMALDWDSNNAVRALVLRDTDDTEDSDEEEDEAVEEDAEIEEPDSDVLWTAEPNAVHGHGKPSRREIEDELEETEGDEAVEESDGTEREKAEENDRKDAEVDRAIDSALGMSALAAVRSDFAAHTRGLNEHLNLECARSDSEWTRRDTA